MRSPRSSCALVVGVEIGAELREGRQLAELREVELDLAGDLFDRLDLRGGTDAADRETDRNGRTDALVEKIGFEIDLAVGDRDDVRRNVSRHVAGLRLDDRQRGQRTAADFFRRRARCARAGGEWR